MSSIRDLLLADEYLSDTDSNIEDDNFESEIAEPSRPRSEGDRSIYSVSGLGIPPLQLSEATDIEEQSDVEDIGSDEDGGLFGDNEEGEEEPSDVEDDFRSLTDFSSGSGDDYLPADEESSDTDEHATPLRRRKKRRRRSHQTTPNQEPEDLQRPESSFQQTTASPTPPEDPQPPGSPSSQRQVSPLPQASAMQSPEAPATPPQHPASSTLPGPSGTGDNLWVRLYPPERPINISSKFKVRNPGPRHTTGCSKPLDFFFLFMNHAVWNLMVQETNAFAHKMVGSITAAGRLAQKSRLRGWVDVTVFEMKKFWAILINMGLSKRKNTESYWSTQPNLIMPFFSKVMPLRRFQQILSMFHLSSRTSPPRGQPGYDPWVKIRQFIDHLNHAFCKHFAPNQEICIDESMIGMKNRCAFIQYMANKRHSRFGIKKFEICDSATSYVLHSALYSGRDFLADGTDPFTQKVVHDLMSKTRLYRKYHHLFTDNFYTKIPLAKHLLVRKTYLTGTIRQTSKHISRSVKQAAIDVGQSLYFRKGKVLIVKYKERATRKPVLLISTACHAEDKRVTSRSGNERSKPVVIASYNQHMGGVDCKDKSVYHLTCTRQTKKYWKKIVYNFVDMALLNAYILYRYHSIRPMSRSEFLNNIVNNLVLDTRGGGDAPAPQDDLPRPPLEHRLEHLPGNNRRNCAVCQKRSLYWCILCNVGVHQKCFPQMEHFYRSEARGGGKRPREEESD